MIRSLQERLRKEADLASSDVKPGVGLWQVVKEIVKRFRKQ